MSSKIINSLIKNYRLVIFMTIIFGLVIGGIPGAILASLCIGIIGLVIGLYRKKRSIWMPFLISISIIIAGITLFFIALVNSDM